MKSKAAHLFVISFLFLNFFLFSITKVSAGCTSNSECAPDEFCYFQSGICNKKVNAPQTKSIIPKFVTPKGNCGDGQIDTALGCISTSVDATGDSFFGSIIKIAVGLGGGLALILMLYGVFIVTTSAGIPDKLKEGQEVITSAVSGLIFIILSVFLLNLIGINILGIPGLN
jgi:hypothetical protein